jgi:hypothetical protein
VLRIKNIAMIKVYVVGDCHTARLGGHHINAHLGNIENLTRFNPTIEERNAKNIFGTDIELNFWGLAGYKCYDLDIEKDINDNLLSSNPEDALDIPGKTDNTKLRFELNEIKNADLVLPWMGYIDLRNYLPKYKNTEKVVSHYVNTFLGYFKNSKIRFIEPFPQFKNLNIHNYPDEYSYEEKIFQEDIFKKYLNSYSLQNNLMDPVSQNLVYKSIEEDVLTKTVAKRGNTEYHNETIIDALKPSYNKIIYKNLVEEVIKTVDTLF